MLKRHINKGILEISDEKGNVILSSSEEMIDGVFYFTLKGQMRNDAACEFEDELMAALSVCGRIVLSFKEVSYIASTAMRSLLSVQQIMDERENSRLLIKGVSDEVMKTFDAYGFTNMLEIEGA